MHILQLAITFTVSFLIVQNTLTQKTKTCKTYQIVQIYLFNNITVSLFI